MIISKQWYNIAKTSTLGSTTGIRIEFGSYYALIAVAVDYGNVVITAVESNIGEEKIKVGARIRYNREWHADVRISPAIEDADLKASVYENNGWTAVSPNTSTTGTTVCIIDDIDSLIQHTGSEDSLWEKVNIGTKEAPVWGLRPKDIDNTIVGIFSDTFITAGGRSGSDNSPSNLFTRLDSWDKYDETAGDVLSALLGYGLKQDIEALKKSGMLDESKLKAYLDKYNYLTKAAADLLYAPINSGGLWEKVNIGTEESPIWAVRPKDIDNTVVGIVSDTFITAGGRNGNSSDQGTATSLGGLVNVDDTADDLQSEAVVLTKGANATHWTLRALSTLGLNKAELENYLAANSYLKKDTADSLYTPLASFNALNTKVNDFLEGSDADAIINKWKELEAFLVGQTESSTLAELLAIKANQSALDAHIANYNNFVNNTYATHIAAYNTHIADYNSFKNTTNDRLVALESLWAIDEENNALYPRNSRGIWSYDFITAGGKANSGSSSGGLIKAVYDYNNLGGNFNNNNLTDTFNAYAINSIYNEVQKLKESAGSAFNETALWQSLAKVDTTKVIDSSHIPDLSGKYLSVSGGTINGTLEINHNGTYPLIVNGTDLYSVLQFTARSKRKAEVGWLNDDRGNFAFLLNADSLGAISVNEHGAYFAPNASDFTKYPILHTGNYADTTDKRYLQLSGGTITFSGLSGLTLKRTTNNSNFIHFIGGESDFGYLGFSGVGNPTFADSEGYPYSLVHTGNYADTTDKRYLQLSGGTVTGFIKYELTGIYPSISYNKDGVFWGDLGFSKANTPAWSDGATWYPLIHSGNIGSQSVNYASSAGVLKLVPYQNPDTSSIGQIFSTPRNEGIPSGARDYLSGITLASNNDANYKVQLGLDNLGIVFSRRQSGGTWKDWNRLAFITDNVASATKLQTARTLWGQSFDGSANVSGDIHLNQSDIYWHNDKANYSIESVIREAASPYLKIAHFGGIRFQASGAEWMRIEQRGNVLIGTTTDNIGKLQVKGAVSAYGSSSELGGYAYYWGTKNQYHLGSNGDNDFYLGATTASHLRIGTNNAEIVRITSGGNVLMGTTTDSGYKLDINGTLNAGATTLTTLTTSGNTTIGGTLGVKGSIETNNINGGGGALYLGNESNDSFVILREDMKSAEEGWNIRLDGTASFGDTYIDKLEVNGNISQQSGNSAYLARTEVTSLYSGGNITCMGYLRAMGTVYVGSSGDEQSLYITNNLMVDSTINAYGDIFSEGEMTAGAIGSSSDKRLKNDIELLEPERAISLIMALKPSTWKWNCNSKLVGKRSYGLIAQEVAPYLPEAVMDNKDYLSLVYNQFHAFEISVLQNHETRFERVERENREMRCEIERLNKELNQYRRV